MQVNARPIINWNNQLLKKKSVKNPTQELISLMLTRKG